MKQEDKELLLNELCARLPYGVRVDYKEDKFDFRHWKMKKLILCVLATIALYAFLYAIWSFAHWELNPKDWETGSRVFYCIITTSACPFVNMGIILHVEKK